MLKVLLTSRPMAADGVTAISLDLPDDAGVTMHTHNVGTMEVDAAVGLLSTRCPDLLPDQLAQLAQACGCMPLTLRLVADAITGGRVTPEVGWAALCRAARACTMCGKHPTTL